MLGGHPLREHTRRCLTLSVRAETRRSSLKRDALPEMFTVVSARLDCSGGSLGVGMGWRSRTLTFRRVRLKAKTHAIANT